MALFDAALAEGSTFWDTAAYYGDNEELIGRWFKHSGKRDKIFIATKGGFTRAGTNNDPEFLKAALESSLKNLGVDTIDLYYLARIQRTIPIEKTVAVLAEFVKAGKVKYIGLSECSAATLRRAHAVHPITAVEVEYSPFALDIEGEKNGLLKTCRELGVAVVAYSPLGRGVLTGAYKSPDDFHPDDSRRKLPRFSNEAFPYILSLVDVLQDIAKAHNATPGQVTLAWILAQGEDIIPIPGTKTVKYLSENAGAVNFKLTAEEIKSIRQSAQNLELVVGDLPRYPDGLAGDLFADTIELS
uniref:NADP-dependent oxidoreductase domain-containing protein n=1 Tax=Psilocybe cubensis TaxID=181762 RepID=A0A8H8CGA7_PSICU